MPSSHVSHEVSSNNNNTDAHCRCNVCARLPLRTHCCGMNSDLAHAGFYDHFDIGLFEMYLQNMQERDQENALPRINHRNASKTADAAQRHLTHLQTELENLGLLQPSQQSYAGSTERARVMAPFDKREVVLGPRLGSGGFSSVSEVHSFRFLTAEEDSAYSSRHENFSEGQKAAREYLQKHAEDSRESYVAPDRRNSKLNLLDFTLTQRSQARYAVKHLRYSLVDNLPKFEKAAIDLTLEAQLLLVMDHPNIVNIRGWSQYGTDSFRGGSPSDYFIIIDCLPEQLEDRFFAWRQQIRKYRSKRSLFWNQRRRKFQIKLQNLLVERLQVAHDIASALEYLHDRRVMHRDLKSSNIGFDRDGVVQIFDLGLARLLPPESECLHDGYVMSRVGTRSSMAPEVVDKKPYNAKADVYSFGVVLWEILSVSTAGEYLRMMDRRRGGRGSGNIPRELLIDNQNDASTCPTNIDDCILPICSCWPMSLQDLVKSCLAHDADQRPTMSQVRQALLGELQNLGFVNMSPKRRRSTFRLDLTNGDMVAAAKAAAAAFAAKGKSQEDLNSSTAFASLSYGDPSS